MPKIGGVLGQFADLRGRGGGFDTPTHTMGKVEGWEILRNGGGS